MDGQIQTDLSTFLFELTGWWSIASLLLTRLSCLKYLLEVL